MSNYQEQINRIKDKFAQAKAKDVNLEVFGAKGHEYHLNPPVSEQEIAEYEAMIDTRLPDCFRAFLLHINDPKATTENSIAGPYYGLYDWASLTNSENSDASIRCLKNPCLIMPKMTDEQWNALIAPLDDNDLDDEAYDQLTDEILGGLLPIGSQGCTYYHALVLNGEYAGRVVNMDMDLLKPKFCYEANFLDWYERWLDEIISGELIGKQVAWFGYQRGEKSEELIHIFETSTEKEDKIDCQNALLSKKLPFSRDILQKIEYFLSQEDEYYTRWVRILCKSDFERAKKYLPELANKDLLAFFQNIYWYAPDKKAESCYFLPLIETKMAQIDDEETLDFCGYVLRETGTDYTAFMLPFAKHSNPKIRQTAMYNLGNSPNQEKYLDIFIAGLQDAESDVVHSTLQAIKLTDKRLLPYYKEVALRFPKENDSKYIIPNLNHRLKPYGLDNESILKKN